MTGSEQAEYALFLRAQRLEGKSWCGRWCNTLFRVLQSKGIEQSTRVCSKRLRSSLRQNGLQSCWYWLAFIEAEALVTFGLAQCPVLPIRTCGLVLFRPRVGVVQRRENEKLQF